MSTMPPISRSRSAPLMCTTSPAASICASQARRSCFGAFDFKAAARGSTLVFMAGPDVCDDHTIPYRRLLHGEAAHGEPSRAVPYLGPPRTRHDLRLILEFEGALDLGPDLGRDILRDLTVELAGLGVLDAGPRRPENEAQHDVCARRLAGGADLHVERGADGDSPHGRMGDIAPDRTLGDRLARARVAG